jgi:hypothetical protein
MSGLSDIIDGWAHQSITVETPGEDDQFGNPSTGTATTYSGILIQRAKLVKDRQGRQVVSSCQILFNGVVSVDVESKLTLPDGTQPTIINVGSTPYFDGINCVTEVYT